VAVRPIAMDQPNVWFMLAMSVYHENFKSSKEARRLEVYGAYTQFEPVQVRGKTRTRSQALLVFPL
jgi:hypothetical protein